MNAKSPHKWWSTRKSVNCVQLDFVFVSACWYRDGGLVFESGGKVDLMSDHFDSKPSCESVDLPLAYHLSPSLITSTFRSSEVRRRLLDLDPYCGTDPCIGYVSSIFKENR